ncbi:MAG: hypothetical protein AB7P69_09370 [Candidatus Binatia bacterium]
MDSLRIMLFLHGALGVIIIAALAYVAGGRRPEFRFALVVTLLLVAALFTFLPFIPAFHPDALGVSGKKTVL